MLKTRYGINCSCGLCCTKLVSGDAINYDKLAWLLDADKYDDDPESRITVSVRVFAQKCSLVFKILAPFDDRACIMQYKGMMKLFKIHPQLQGFQEGIYKYGKIALGCISLTYGDEHEMFVSLHEAFEEFKLREMIM